MMGLHNYQFYHFQGCYSIKKERWTEDTEMTVAVVAVLSGFTFLLLTSAAGEAGGKFVLKIVVVVSLVVMRYKSFDQ